MSRDDFWQLVRFAIVGTTVAGIYVGLYLAFLAAGLAQAAANAAAFGCAVTCQYAGQTWWTFRRPLGVPDQIFRFVCTISLGLVVSALVTGLLGPALGWADWFAAAVVAVVLPVQNFVIFRIWVYAGGH